MADASENDENLQTENADDEDKTENHRPDSDTPQDKTDPETPQQQENSSTHDTRRDKPADVDTEEEPDKVENDDTEPESTAAFSIDVNTMKNLYKFRSRPTLPFLLTEYGMEDKDAPAMKHKKEQKKKNKSKSFDDDTGKDLEKERLREERHLQIVQDMHRLRDYYYDEYTTLLQNKVDKQRHDIRQRSNALDNKIAKQQEAQRHDSHKVKRKLERHKLVSDDSFTKNIPKTDLFYIVQLQDKMIKEGKLVTQTDFDNFWENIQKPEVFYATFKVHKSDSYGETNYNENANSDSSQGRSSSYKNTVSSSCPLSTRNLGQIPESGENSRPNTRSQDSWAITQQFPSQYSTQQSSDKSRRTLSFTGLKHPSVGQLTTKPPFLQELEKRFPKLEMPKLHCFSMELGPKGVDPFEASFKMELRRKERARKARFNKTTKMHQMAMTHSAATYRLLAMTEDLDFMMNGFSLPDLISDFHYYTKIPTPPSTQITTDPFALLVQPQVSQRQAFEASHRLSIEAPDLLPVPEHYSSHSAKPSRQGSGKSVGTSTSAKKRKDKKYQVEVLPELEKPRVLPLSLDEVLEPRKEAKCLSTLWNNYMKPEPACKSVIS